MLSRKTQRLLWRDLIGRCAVPNNRPSPVMWPLTILLTVLALWVFAQI